MGLVTVGTAVPLLLAAGAFLAMTSSGPMRDEQAADSLYAMVFTRGPAWDESRAPGEQLFFREHSQNLARLRREQRILMGGRFGDAGLVLIRARDRAHGDSLFAADSTIARGVFRADLHPWRTIYEGQVPAR